MEDPKSQMRALLQHVRDSGVPIDGDPAAVRAVLDQFDVESESADGEVVASLSGTGKLLGLTVDERTFAEAEAARLGELITEALNVGHEILREGLSGVAAAKAGRR